MNHWDNKKPAEMENTVDEIYTRLARAYGLSKAEIAKLAVKRYGGGEMTEKTDEVLSGLRNLINNPRKDAMERMMEWEMYKSMKRDNEAPRQPPPQPQQQLQQPNPEKMTMQDIMMLMILPQMAKSMGGGEDELIKVYKMKVLMGDDGEGKNLEKLEQMLKDSNDAADMRTQQLLNALVGEREAEKLREKEERIREREERWKKEMEQKVQNAEYMLRHGGTGEQPPPSFEDKLTEMTGTMGTMKKTMEDIGMVQVPPSPEDKKFELEKMDIGHKQDIETEAVKQLAKSADKLSSTVDSTTNKVIDLMAEEQKVKAEQLRMMSPEERKKMEKKYAVLANEVMGEEEPASGESSDYTDEDEFTDED